MKYEDVVIIGGKEIGVDEIVNATTASRIVGLAERTLRDYGVSRRINVYKYGNRNMFLVRDLLEFSEERRVEAVQQT